MICQHRVTAGVDLKLGHSCPREPYRAPIFVFLAERDNLSVPLGAKTERLGPSDTRSPEWNLGNGAVPLPGPPHEGCVISGLCLFVGTLSWKPSHQLHVNLVSKLPYDFLLLSFFKPPPQPLDKFTNYTTPLLIILSFSLAFCSSSIHFCLYSLLPCTSKSQIHTHKHVAQHGFGDMWWWQWTALKRLQWWKTSQPSWEAIFCFTPGKIYELSTQHLCSPAEM